MADALAEKLVQPAINPKHLAYCPTMDMIALASVDEHIHVYRLNGQKVFGIINKQSANKVNQIKWKPNGQSLAAAYDNNSLSMTNAHTGKVVHLIDCSEYSKSQICCLGWGINLTDANKVSLELDKFKVEVTLDDVISQNPRMRSLKTVPDLPLDLAMLDVEASLPKLSPLSSGGIEDDVFSSRASLDTLFQPLTTDSTDYADIFVVGFEDGTVHLSIYDFFEIGRFNLHQASSGFRGCRPILHCSHPCSTTHSMLVSNFAGDQEEMYIVPLDLRLLSNAGRYLSLLASKSTQLHNLLRYIHQVERQIHNDFKASQELPSRFMANIEESLREHADCNWMQAAYHLVVTGDCSPQVKEWLVDQLGERGHKRWEKATTTGYESVQRLAHENLLPALERFTVLVSRLRDTIDCLQLVAHQILKISGSELRQFYAFSAWLRQEIDVQASDASMAELADIDLNIDHASTLEYIQGAMTLSQLASFFNLEAQGEEIPPTKLAAEGRSLFELCKRGLQKAGTEESSAGRFPTLNALVKYLDTQCNAVFNGIAETQRRSVRFGAPVYLQKGTPSCMDMRMVREQVEGKEQFLLYVILGPVAHHSEVRIYRTALEIKNGVSSTKTMKGAVIETAGWEVKDVKFIDDGELLLAVSANFSSRLFRIPYQGKFQAFGVLANATKNERNVEQRMNGNDDHFSIDLSNPDVANAFTWQKFPEGVSWSPERMDVNGKKNRRAICVVAQDRFNYRVYDLDSSRGGEVVEET
ncbi:anaphase-promoting complex, cyclosome, subunit 4-domain-containing protein [Usnea florida]